MTKEDLNLLDEDEARAVDDSFDQGEPQTRIRNMSLGAMFVVALVALLVGYGASATAVGSMFAFYVVLSTLEKLTYAREQLISRSAMTKVIRRMERLEHVPQTPDNGRPSQKARLVAA